MESERFTGKSWEVWREELSLKSPRTAHVYTRELSGFLEWADLTTESLFELHWKNIKSDDPRDLGRVPRQMLLYMRELEKQGKARATQYQPAKAASSFFRSNGLPFELSSSKPRLIITGKDRMRKTDIRELIERSGSLRNDSMIMTLKDSGLRIGDLARLKVKHVKGAIGKEFHLFDFTQEKTEGAVKVALGPEAIRYLEKWFKKRELLGVGLDPEASLYVALERRPEVTDKNGKHYPEVKPGDPLTASTISSAVYRMIRKAGLGGKNISAHSLRKSHESALEAARLPDPWIAQLQGRIIQDTRRAYSKPTDAELLEAYKEAYDSLAVFDVRAVEREEIEALTAQVAEMEDLVEVLRPLAELEKRKAERLKAGRKRIKDG